MDDKDQHKLAGTLIALIAGGLLYLLTKNIILSWPIGLATGCLAGVVKEFYDLKVKKTLFNWLDLWATVFGAALGTIILVVIIDIIRYGWN